MLTRWRAGWTQLLLPATRCTSAGAAAATLDPERRKENTIIANFASSFRKENIPKDLLTVQYARSRGPGGQNVNKVNTKADVRFKLHAADWLPAPVRSKLREQEANRINKDGELVITSERNRLQHQNYEDCIQKLHEMIMAACHVTKEPTAEQRARVEQLRRQDMQRRRDEKKRRSRSKRDRNDS